MKTISKVDTIVVTRHRPLVDLLIERGLATPETPVIEHATPDDVRGRHVIGVLPHHLSCLAAYVTEVPIRLDSPDERAAMARGDIPLERLREIAGEAVTYHVRLLPQLLLVGDRVEHMDTHARGTVISLSPLTIDWDR